MEPALYRKVDTANGPTIDTNEPTPQTVNQEKIVVSSIDHKDQNQIDEKDKTHPPPDFIRENKPSLPATSTTSEEEKKSQSKDKPNVLPEVTAVWNEVSVERSRVPSAIVRRMRQPFKILIDIWGVLTSYNFRSELLKYIDLNLKDYLFTNFDKEDIKLYVDELIARTSDDLAKFPEMPSILITEKDKEATVKSIADNLNFRRHHKNKILIQGLDSIFNQIWNEGYIKKKLRPHLFPDVLPNFKKWHGEPFFIKIYTFASGPVEIQKLFLNASIGPEVTEYITSGFDAHHRYKYDPSKYRGVLSSLCERDPKNLFYLTDSPTKGKEARKVGMTVFIVLREGNRRYKPHQLESFTVISSFDEFEFYEFC